MADQRIDYTSTNDDDIRTSTEAISPYNDGERIAQSVLRRPSESLRSRSEVDRTALEELKYLADANVKWLVTGGNASGVGASLPQITTWDPDAAVGPDRGVFTTSADAVFQPLTTVRADTLGNTFVWTFDDGTDSGTLTVSNKLLASEGGDVLSLEIEYTATTGILTLEKLDSAGKIQRVKITVSGDASKSMTDLKTALEADSDITDRFTLVWGGNWNATEIDTGQTVPPAGIYSPTEKPWEREMHLLQPSDLASFFSASDNNKLQDGDTLAIYYPYLVDPDKFLDPGSGTDDGRRQACVSNTNVTLSSTQLVNLGTEPDKLPYCIPICKRIGDDLYFIDGTVIKGELLVTDPAIYFGEHGYTVGRYSSDGGAAQIGVTGQAAPGGEASADTWDIPTDDLQDVLGASSTGLQDFINNKGSLNTAETATEPWIFDSSGGTGTNLTAVDATGKGTGNGVYGTGGTGTTGGNGLRGQGGVGTSTSGYGAYVVGAAATLSVDGGDGLRGYGGNSVDGDAGDGVRGYGGTATGAGANGAGVRGSGTGDSTGVVGQGGNADSGRGVEGTGGTATSGNVNGGYGGVFTGGDAFGTDKNGGYGIYASGGDRTGTGLVGYGVYGVGGSDGTGVAGVGGSGNGRGVYGQGTGTEAGVVAQGGPSGSGLIATAGASGAEGVLGVASFSGAAGVYGKNLSGYGVVAEGKLDPSSGGGYSAFRILPQSGVPQNAQMGDLYVDTSGIMWIFTTSWTKVGAQN